MIQGTLGPSNTLAYEYLAKMTLAFQPITQEGDGETEAPSLLFSDELGNIFIQQVANSDSATVETSAFTLTYVGQETVTLQTGESYDNADVIRLTDINPEQFTSLHKELANIFVNLSDEENSNLSLKSDNSEVLKNIEISEIIVKLKIDEVPTLGAITFDLKGSYKSFIDVDFNVGLDYTPKEHINK